jgi:hypothetical protein
MLPDTGRPVTRDELEAENDALRSQLMYTHAILAIMLELEGGVIQITNEVLNDYDLSTQIQMRLDDEALVWTIGIVQPGEVVSDVTA